MKHSLAAVLLAFHLLVGSVYALDVVVLNSGAELRGEILQRDQDGLLLDLLPGTITLKSANIKQVRRENNVQWYIERVRNRDARQTLHILDSALRAGMAAPAIRNAYLAPAIQVARTHLENMRYSDAAELSKRALVLNPDSDELAALLASAEAAISRTEAEIRALSFELQRNPENDYARLLLGRALRTLDRQDEAFTQYQMIVAGKIRREYQRDEIDELDKFIAEHMQMYDAPQLEVDISLELPIETREFRIPGFTITVHDAQTGKTIAAALPAMLEGVRKNLQLPTELQCDIFVLRDRHTFIETTGHVFGEGYSSGEKIWTYHGAPGMLENILPHELAHVVLHHQYDAVPEWLDEGLAIRQEQAAGAYWHVLKHDSPHPLKELLRDRRPAENKADNTRFYASAYSFTDMLISIGGMSNIHRLIDSLSKHAPEQALREVYGISSMKELEELWKRHLAN